MPAIDLSATPYYSMAISLAKSPLFSIAIHPMSVVHCKKVTRKVTRLRQVCHQWVRIPVRLLHVAVAAAVGVDISTSSSGVESGFA
jgi:hypothetical protein